jgi:hypothetical protein
MTSEVDGVVRAHTQSVQDSAAEFTAFLRDHLGAPLVALMADVDVRTVNRWTSGEVNPRDAAERRIRAAYQVFRLLEGCESARIIRAWFMGMNPQLDDLSTIEVIADDQCRDVMSAARAFASGG